MTEDGNWVDVRFPIAPKRPVRFIVVMLVLGVLGVVLILIT